MDVTISELHSGFSAQVSLGVWLSWDGVSSYPPTVEMAQWHWDRWRERVWPLIRAGWSGEAGESAYGCTPVGCRVTELANPYRCERRSCLFCHARRVGTAAESIRSMIQKLPRRGAFEVVSFAIPEYRPTTLRRQLGRVAPGGAVWSYCTLTLKNQIRWRTVGITVLPVGPSTWEHVDKHYGMTDDATVLRACVVAFRYPRAWHQATTTKLTRFELAHTYRDRYWASYGLARNKQEEG